MNTNDDDNDTQLPTNMEKEEQQHPERSPDLFSSPDLTQEILRSITNSQSDFIQPSISIFNPNQILQQ